MSIRVEPTSKPSLIKVTMTGPWNASQFYLTPTEATILANLLLEEVKRA